MTKLTTICLAAAVALVAIALVPAPAEAAGDIWVHCQNGTWEEYQVLVAQYENGDFRCVPGPTTIP